MKISGWHIDGFGVLSNSVIDDLPPGLTVLHGPNEAGKSTLLAFIRGVLFGYPTGNTRELKYPPLDGKAHGGRIFLQTPDGRWTIERTARRGPASVTHPDGSAGTSADLDRLLGYATKPLFKSVFAFSLSELQEFSSLDDGDVREKVFAAGITGVGTSAREAIATLDARATELMKPRSSSVLRDLAQEMEELDAQLVDGRRQLEAHGQLVLDEAMQTEEIDDLRERIGNLIERQRRLTLLQDLWPIWDARRRSTEQLGNLPDTSGFPDDGDTRLATAAQTVRSALRGLEACTDKQARLMTEREALAGDDRLAAVARRLEAVAGEVVLHRTGLERSSAKRVEVDRAQQRLDETLLELGPDWDESRLRALNTSIPRREEVREWQTRLDRTGSARADAAREADVARTVAAAASGELDELMREAADLGEPPSGANLDELDRLMAQLRAELTELSRLEERLASTRARVEDAETQAQTDAPVAAAFDLAATGRKLKWAAALAVLIAVALGAAGQLVAASLVVVLAIAAAVTAERLDAAHRRHEAAASAEPAQSPQERAVRARRAADDVAAEVEQRQAEALDTAQRAGFAAAPTAAQLELRATDVTVERRARDRLDDCQKRLDQAQHDREAADQDATKLAAAADACAEAAAAASHEWVQWRMAAGVDDDLAPASCLDLFETVRRARELMSVRDRLDQDLEDLEEQLSAWEHRAQEVLADAGRQSDAQRPTLPDDIVVAHRAAQDDAQQRLRAKELDDQIAELEAQVKGHEADREQGRADTEAVLLEAGVTSGDEFAGRQSDHAERVEHLRLVDAADTALRKKLGSDDPAHPVLVDVATGDLEGWASDHDAAEIERQQLEQERDTAIGARSEAQVRRLDLEKSADVPSWEAERAEKLTELQRAAHEWRVIQVARQLITDTLASYVRERQPGVLRVAGRHFSTVTAGRYTRLGLPSDGTSHLEVIDARGSRRALNELSRGTAEQLYLCMRMGLAAEVAERATGLPIVMDDVLVNFSPDRAAAMVEVLAEAAENGQQILFFTCHPSIRDLILERVGDARVEELEPLSLD